jgi:hypothetical protein
MAIGRIVMAATGRLAAFQMAALQAPDTDEAEVTELTLEPRIPFAELAEATRGALR